MASKIYHGNPGSYKSSSAVWFDLVPALRNGRCVVTNVEGILDLESMERALGEKFPASAQLWRFSTLNDVGNNIISKWFHWLPVGALLLIDEVQNVYSDKDRNELKEHNVSLGPDFSTDCIMRDVADLPDDLRLYSMSCIESIVDDGYKDDLALSERDSNGHVRYPRNIKDALMRHRKFNWDILLCTPDISKVHSLIRSVAETAVQHKSLDSFPLPYFQRRPRTFDHNAQEKGLSAKKGDIIKRRKIPLDVFKLYKSTQTGKNNKSGAAASPLESNGFKFALVLLLSFLAYWIYFLSGFGSNDESSLPNESIVLADDVKIDSLEISETVVTTFDYDNSDSSIVEVFNPEPLEGYTFFATGSMEQLVFNRTFNDTETVSSLDSYLSFEIVFIDVYDSDSYMFSSDSDDLKRLGYDFQMLADCVYRVTYADVSRVVICRDREQPEDTESRTDLLASSPIGLN